MRSAAQSTRRTPESDIASAPDAIDSAYRYALVNIGGYARHVAAAGWRSDDGFAALPLTDKSLVFCGSDGPWLPDGPLSAGSIAFTSSGLGGQFSLGVSDPAELAATASAANGLMSAAGATPLVLGCLPQGIAVPVSDGVSASAGTNVAGALALIRAFAHRQGSLVLAAEPLLAKELLERVSADESDGTYPILVLTGGEWPSEGLRRYLEGLLPGRARVVFSYGAAELGLGAMLEDDALMRLRAQAYASTHLRSALTGGLVDATPALYRWDQNRLHLETTCAGELVVTTLQPRPVPLVRYNIGDQVELVSGATLRERIGGLIDVDDLPEGPVCLHYGRSGPVSASLSAEAVKDWLFRAPERAQSLTGRFSIRGDGTRIAFQRNLAGDWSRDAAIIVAACSELGAETVKVWAHADYPHHEGGHERKATYMQVGR